MPRVPRIAVLAPQYMAVHAQAHANAGAPGEVGAVGQGLAVDLERSPAAFGLQCGNAIIFDPHPGKNLAQRRFQQSGLPVVGQTPRRSRQAAADVGRGQLHQALVHHKRAAGRHPHRGQIANRHVGGPAALPDQPDDLARQRIVGTLFGRGFGHMAPHTPDIGDTDRHLGATDVYTGDWRRTVGQTKSVG